MKSFKRYIKERVTGVGPGGGDAMEIGVDSDTGMSAGDITNENKNIEESLKNIDPKNES